MELIPRSKNNPGCTLEADQPIFDASKCPSINYQILDSLSPLYQFKMENEAVALPRRIKGKHLGSFRECTIDTNYYGVKVGVINEIYIYKVVFTPFIPHDNIKQRLELLQNGMSEIRTFIPSPVVSGANLFSLSPPTETQRDIQVDGYTIKIKQVKVISVGSNPKALLMFLNNGLRNMFGKIGYTEIGRTGKFFKISSPENLDADLKMFPGFKANFMAMEKGIYLRVDSAKKIVRNQTVLDFINSIYGKNKSKDRDQKRVILKSELIGQIIMTNYGKSRYLKVVDVVFDTVDEYKLNGQQTTLREFYEKKYNRKINQGKQPLIEVESKAKKQGEKCILVPELCLMTGIPDSFDEFKRKKISEATIKSPNEKKRDIEDFMRQADKVNDLSSLKQIGIQISKKLSQIKAKIIPAPKLQLGNNRTVDNGREANFQLFRDPLYNCSQKVKCGIFTVQNADVRGLLDTFKNTSRSLNVSFSVDVYTSRENDRNRILQSYFSEIGRAIDNDGINIALIVIPSFLKQNYGEIKRQCLKNLNIVSQCVVDSTLRKKNLQSIATKLLLQMIAKRGNVLWVPKMTGRLSETMIMAFDSAKGHGKNILSCCGTINDTFSEYYSKSAVYNNNQDKFNEMVKLSFETINYAARKDKSPREVVIFHNSCSGDQVAIFKSFFLDTLNGKLVQSMGSSKAPKLSLVMVNTKTSERFFINDNGGSRNVNAGTLVADEIVSQFYEFFLVSQGSNRGSTVPNHYRVVHSNSEIEQGLLHELIFSQCFNYVNWTGSIKIPGILQYAKKCAKFSAEALQGEGVQSDLDNKLYFV